jgi:hypothetical protein
MANTVNLSDPKLYSLVKESKQETEQKEKISQTVEPVKSTMVILENEYANSNPLMRFLTIAFIIALVGFLLYITVYRFVLGYNFIKAKEYFKGAAAFSPELVALSTSILL